MGNLPLLNNYLSVGAILFTLGLIGFLSRRNLIVMFLCAELMLQGVSLTLVGFSTFHGSWGGQVFTIFSLALAGAEAAVALALIVVLFRRNETLDISLWQDLREADQPPVLDEFDAAAAEAATVYPELTRAGLLPGQGRDPGHQHRTLDEAIEEQRHEPVEVPHA
jgi:NADH-quinone oxidoreductase subunit K